MKAQIALAFSMFCTFLCLDQNVALGQTQPQSSYSFTGLTAGIRSSYFGFFADDFVSSFANQNGNEIKLTVQLNDPGYQFVPCSVVGTYTYNTLTVPSLSAAAINVQGESVLSSGPEFSGSMTVHTLGGQTFYIMPPTSITATSSSGRGTECAAWYNAWESGSWTVPFFWDGTANKLIAPYANYWHNDHFWDVGWNSNITIRNNGSQSVNYTINYVRDFSQAVLSYNPGNSCTTTTLPTSASNTVGPGGTWSTTLRNILNPNASHTVDEDGFIYVVDSPIIPGTSPSMTITPNANGSSGCGGSCALIFSCR